MKRRNRIILDKIIEEADFLSLSISGIDETEFLRNEMIKRATCMTLINIGELIKNLEDDIRTKYSEIPWKDFAGFRDVAAHGYFTLRMDRVWLYAKDEMPVFADQIKEILDSEEETD